MEVAHVESQGSLISMVWQRRQLSSLQQLHQTSEDQGTGVRLTDGQTGADAKREVATVLRVVTG